MSNIADLSQMQTKELSTLLVEAFMCEALVNGVIALGPFSCLDDLIDKTEQVWHSLPRETKINAFMRHPKIGDIETVRKTRHSQTEQRGIYAASEQVLADFVTLNRRYEAQFGYLYLVFAPGKSASQMLNILKTRLNNDAQQEFQIACEQKHCINRFRLEKLFATAMAA